MVECYDGQWQNMVMTTEEGEPLTKLRLVQHLWTQINKLSKYKLLEEMSSISKINLGDRDLISMTTFPVGTFYDNFEVDRHFTGTLHVSS